MHTQPHHLIAKAVSKGTATRHHYYKQCAADEDLGLLVEIMEDPTQLALLEFARTGITSLTGARLLLGMQFAQLVFHEELTDAFQGLRVHAIDLTPASRHLADELITGYDIVVRAPRLVSYIDALPNDLHYTQIVASPARLGQALANLEMPILQRIVGPLVSTRLIDSKKFVMDFNTLMQLAQEAEDAERLAMQ